MYVVEKKVGTEYIMQVAKCNRCLSDNIEKINDKYICLTCGKEYTIDEMQNL